MKEHAITIHVRLRQRCLALGAATALGFSLWSCGGADPSGPPFATFSGTVSGNRMSGVVMDATHPVQMGTFAATRP